MKKLISIILILFLSFLSSPSWSENLVCKYTGFNCPEIDDFEELVEVDGLFYKKYTETPFTGKVIGYEQGSIKDGKREGSWVGYHENGQLWFIENYKDGKKDGFWEYYFENGILQYKGNLKDGKEDGFWESYHDNGRLEYEINFKDGKKDGLWVYYFENGQLEYKGNYKDGKVDGLWEYYNEDGSIDTEKTGTYKYGMKQE